MSIQVNKYCRQQQKRKSETTSKFGIGVETKIKIDGILHTSHEASKGEPRMRNETLGMLRVGRNRSELMAQVEWLNFDQSRFGAVCCSDGFDQSNSQNS